MSPRRGDIDLPSYDNQYGNGYSRGGAVRKRHYDGDLPSYENQYGSGGHRSRVKTVPFFSKRLNKPVKFKAKANKTKKKHVRRRRARRR